MRPREKIEYLNFSLLSLSFCLMLSSVHSQDVSAWPEAMDAADDNKCINATLTVSFNPDGLTTRDVIGVILSSVAMRFSDQFKPRLAKYNKSIHWRIPHIYNMAEITKSICPGANVSPVFINLVANFILIYYNSLEEVERPQERIAYWDDLALQYDDCRNASTPLTFTTNTGRISRFEVDGNSRTVMVAEEKADKLPVLDFIIDAFWFMFELTAVTCFKTVGSEPTWLSNYFNYFRTDFTSQLEEWWANPGNTNYGLLFGDMDLSEMLYNLRACAVASFQFSDIEDRLLVRPVHVDVGEFFQQNLNQRTY